MRRPCFIMMPLDARPVCYQQVLDLAAIGNLTVHLPPPDHLGVLKKPAPFDPLFSWWSQQLQNTPEAGAILSMETLAYGGLIAGRVNEESLETLQARIDRYLQALTNTHRPRYGFASILRIPAYDNAEEEPDYWAQYGAKLYRLSEQTHREGTMPEDLAQEIPQAVLHDFLSRREKNFTLNQTFLTLLKNHVLDFLIYCQDDTGPYGLNVQEAQQLAQDLTEKSLQSLGHVQTGADEAALVLLARAVLTQTQTALKIYPWFFPAHGQDVMARFDGQPIGQVVRRHIHTIGGTLCDSPDSADLILAVNAPSRKMGDHCSGEKADTEMSSLDSLLTMLNQWIPKAPVTIADVVYANGADPALMRGCLEKQIPLHQLVGYAGWNTPGNTIGTALAIGVVTLWARQNNRLNQAALDRLLITRLLDDWLYESEVRARLRQQYTELPPEETLNREMQPGIQLLKKAFPHHPWKPIFSFPCNRTFEIAVSYQDADQPAYQRA